MTDSPQTLPPFSLELLPEPYRTDPVFKDFKDWDGVLKSHAAAARLVGTDKNYVFKIPKDGDYGEVYTKLGKPADGNYEFPTDLKGALDDNAKAVYSKFANEHNLTKAQLESLVRFEDARTDTARSVRQAAETLAQEQAESALRTALGEAYDQTINLAKDALETFEATPVWDKLEKAGLTKDPQVIGYLAGIAKLSKAEDDILNGDRTGSFKLTPAQAQAEVNALLSDKNFVKQLTNPNDPAHKDAVAKRWELLQKAYPV